MNAMHNQAPAHSSAFRLRKQEQARGAASQDMDFGVERLMQLFKTATGRRTSLHPEKSFINVMLRQEAFKLWERQQRRITVPHMRTYAELKSEPGLSNMQGRMYDVDPYGTRSAPILLIGKGQPLPKCKKEAALDSVLQVR